MPGGFDSLSAQYAAALKVYLQTPGEEALRLAGQIGQRGLDEGLGILDALALHEQALASLGPAAGLTIAAATNSSTQANEFLRGLLAPFDLKLRSALQMQEELERSHQTALELGSQIEAVNKELESFRYSVSHDLRAPLRAIDGFSGILEEEHSKDLNEDGRYCLATIRSSTRRLGQLIEDLLLLVRVGRAELKRQTIHISNLAQEVANELQHKQPDRKVAFHVQEGLTTDADPHLLRTVLESLLENAWKFTGQTAEPHVEFGLAERPDGPAFFVRDNGVGFDMQYAGRLFTPFQRVHTEAEFPGTGIGLAVVRRIVERHGGRVWFEAAVGRGATFYFTLGGGPKQNCDMT